MPSRTARPRPVGVQQLRVQARELARGKYDGAAEELDLHETHTFTWMLNGKKTSGKWTATASVVELVPTHRDGKELPPQLDVPLLRDGDRLVGRRCDLGRGLNVYVKKE